jgi:molecular chaperone HscB
LSLRGVDVVNDERMKVEDPALLMEVLEAREDIEAAQDEETLEALRKMNMERITQSEDVLEKAFKSDNLGMAKTEAVRLRYWINIQERLNAWEA